MPKFHKHLFPQVCAVANVLAAARTAMQGKLNEASAAHFHSRWETHAVQLAEELAAGTWQLGPYTYFDIHEPNIHWDGFDHFAKQELGVKGYVRYVEGFTCWVNGALDNAAHQDL